MSALQDIADGESVEVPGSGSNVYTLANNGGVYSCSCPAWRHQGGGIERRSCKHLRRYRGDQAEADRVGSLAPMKKTLATQAAKDAKAPKLLLAHKWDGVQALDGWWISEKLDGLRAYWDGTHFMSRLGNVFMAPDWFTEELGDEPLDGELWVARGEFQRAVSIVRRQDKSDHWKEVRYVVFDAPSRDEPFEARIAHLESALEGKTYASALEHRRCEGEDDIRDELARVEALGGEGLMLRAPGSKYQSGRSSTLLKVKSFSDAEGLVVGHEPGKGKHKGRCGALVMEAEDGVRFKVGTGMSDKEREDPPPVGAVVTYRFQELTKKGVPRFPTFVGVRIDAKMGGSSAHKVTVQTAPPVPSATSPAPAVPTGAGADGDATEIERHSLQFVGGSSAKFWEVVAQERGGKHESVVRYGRIGAKGQAKKTPYSSKKSMLSAVRALAEKKRDKGYIDSP